MAFRLSTNQMQAGQRQVQERFNARQAAALAHRYELPLDAQLRDFVEQRRARAVKLGFETDLQVADFIEACLLTRDAILSDPYFDDLMQRPMMRLETKAEAMLRRWVWPHPDWRPVIANEDT